MLFDILQKRRSIRSFEERPVEKNKIEQILKAALLAPSSRSIRPWEFIVVNDRETLADLSQCKPHGASFLKNAALGLVVVADPSKSDVWVEDTSIASAFILLAAQALGLGACWIQVRKRQYDENMTAEDRVKQILEIPKDFVVESIMAIGCPAEEKQAYSDADLKWEKIHYNRFGEKEQ